MGAERPDAENEEETETMGEAIQQRPATVIQIHESSAKVQEGKNAFLGGLKYRQQEGEYSFEHTMWRVHEMMWEKMMGYGHMDRTEGETDVGDELAEDMEAWLSEMSGHGDEDTREERLRELFKMFAIIRMRPSKERLHRLFNLAGSAAFHHDIGFKQMKEKTEYQMSDKEKNEIEVQVKAKMDEFENQEKLKMEVQSR